MESKKRSFSHFQVLLFVASLCVSSAFILSLLAEGLKEKQKKAKELYRSKQLLQACSILSENDFFLLNGNFAVYDQDKNILVKEKGDKKKATNKEILTLFQKRIQPYLTDSTGKLYSFEELKMSEETYLKEHSKEGYFHLRYKLLYLVLPNLEEKKIPYGFVIPINGYGLWGPIYGYLCIGADGDTVIGMTWYDQQETPGLGGNIALASFQNQFKGKKIFQKKRTGSFDDEKAPLGIVVVKGEVKQVYGNSLMAKSAVDGIAGASITVTGVNEAMRTSLQPYRPFLLMLHRKYQEEEK